MIRVGNSRGTIINRLAGALWLFALMTEGGDFLLTESNDVILAEQ